MLDELLTPYIAAVAASVALLWCADAAYVRATPPPYGRLLLLNAIYGVVAALLGPVLLLLPSLGLGSLGASAVATPGLALAAVVLLYVLKGRLYRRFDVAFGSRRASRRAMQVVSLLVACFPAAVVVYMLANFDPR